MDKALFKRLVRGLGMPVVDWIEVTAPRWAGARQAVLDEIAAFAEDCNERRLMVKPARLGSSVGMSIAHAPAERGRALDEAFRFDSLAIVERYLDHPRELEVAVVGNDPAALEAYGPGEVFPGREFYDYVAKYSDGVSEVTPRADVPEALGRRIRSLALDAYRAIGCEGFARVDFLLAGDDALPQRDQHHPGLHPDQPLPADGGHGARQLRGRVPADRAAGRGASGVARAEPPDHRGPAALSAEPMPMRRDLPLRRPGAQVRRQPIRRATPPRLRSTQIYALVLMFLCVLTVISLGGSPPSPRGTWRSTGRRSPASRP